MYNLNPRYVMLNYDIHLMKNTIKNIDIDSILKTCPQINLSKDTLFYHFNDEDYEINKKVNLKEYYFNFIGLYNHFKNNTYCHMLYNHDDLKLLDLTSISIELGFNPTMFYTDELNNKSKTIMNYCKDNQLDGYITYNIKNVINEAYEENTVTYVPDKTPLYPTIYLNKKLNILSNIKLKKADKIMKKSELIKLHNDVFCILINLLKNNLDDESIVDVDIESTFLSKTIQLYADIKYSLTEFFELIPSHLISLLKIDLSNLSDDCGFEFYTDVILDAPNINEQLKADIIIDINIENDQSNNLFDIALKLIAEKLNLTPFIYVYYNRLNKLPFLSQYTLDYIKDKKLDDMRVIYGDMEKLIMNELYMNYRKTVKGARANINFINLEYVKTTYEYIKSHIMNILMNLDYDQAINIINGKIDKSITHYFNVDYVYHHIVRDKYEKPSKLYQDLLYDVAKYKNLPMINLKYLKIISNLSDNESALALNNFINKVELEIYNFYKQYIAGEKLFVDLYQFLGIDAILNYLQTFAYNNQLNKSLVMAYTDVSLISQMENYNVNEFYKEMKEEHESDIDFYKSKLESMKSKIIMVKFLNILSNIFNLSIKDEDTRKYLIYMIERILETLDINKIYMNLDMDWYSMAKIYTDEQNKELYELFINQNTNEKLLEYIYQYFNQTLVNKNKILQYIRNKNLLEIWINYLNKEISTEILSNIVLIDYSKELSVKNEDENNKKSKIEQEREKKQEEENQD